MSAYGKLGKKIRNIHPDYLNGILENYFTVLINSFSF
jgi:hypothetical protein